MVIPEKQIYDDVIKWKHFPRFWPFLREILRSPANSPHKGQWRGALMFSLIFARMDGWVNNREAGNLRRHRAHYDDIVMLRPERAELFGARINWTMRHSKQYHLTLEISSVAQCPNLSLKLLSSHHGLFHIKTLILQCLMVYFEIFSLLAEWPVQTETTK